MTQQTTAEKAPDPITAEPVSRFRPRLVPRPGKPAPRVIIHGRRKHFFGDLYAELMDASWPQLIWVFISTFAVINTAFAICYFGLADLWPGEGITHARRGSSSTTSSFRCRRSPPSATAA